MFESSDSIDFIDDRERFRKQKSDKVELENKVKISSLLEKILHLMFEWKRLV